MKMYLAPKTKLGKWSVRLIIAMPILFIIGRLFYLQVYGSTLAGDTILSDIVMRPGVALSMLAGFASGIIAFATGLTTIIKNKERAVLVLIATITGAFLVLFLIGEVMFPH